MDKKGVVENLIMYIPRFIFFAVVVLTLVFLVRHVVVTYYETYEAEADIYINKMLYDGDGIIRHDTRTHVGVIDLDKFDEVHLNNIISFDVPDEAERPCAKLTLTHLDNNSEIATTFLYKTWYQRLRPKGFFKGPGAPYQKTAYVYVSVLDNKQTQTALLTIDMLVPK